jgi:hypothetical protein
VSNLIGSGRMQIQVVQVRAQDVQVGDVVNRGGHVREGWIEVASMDQLPDGRLNISDATYRYSFTSGPLDLVWLQIAQTLEGNSHLAL